MKYIIAIIQPDRLDPVLDLLEKAEVHLVTVTTVMGRGRQKGISAVYRSVKEAGSLLKKMKLEIAVNEDFVQATISAITAGRVLGMDTSGTAKSLCSISISPSGFARENGEKVPSGDNGVISGSYLSNIWSMANTVFP